MHVHNNIIDVLHLTQWSILLTLSAVVGVTNWFGQNNRMIDTSWCVDSKMTEDVIKDLLLFQGRKKNEIQLPSGPVHFSFQLPPVMQYYLPNRCAMFMPCQLIRLLRLIPLVHQTPNFHFNLPQTKIYLPQAIGTVFFPCPLFIRLVYNLNSSKHWYKKKLSLYLGNRNKNLPNRLLFQTL